MCYGDRPRANAIAKQDAPVRFPTSRSLGDGPVERVAHSDENDVSLLYKRPRTPHSTCCRIGLHAASLGGAHQWHACRAPNESDDADKNEFHARGNISYRSGSRKQIQCESRPSTIVQSARTAGVNAQSWASKEIARIFRIDINCNYDGKVTASLYPPIHYHQKRHPKPP